MKKCNLRECKSGVKLCNWQNTHLPAGGVTVVQSCWSCGCTVSQTRDPSPADQVAAPLPSHSYPQKLCPVATEHPAGGSLQRHRQCCRWFVRGYAGYITRKSRVMDWCGWVKKLVIVYLQLLCTSVSPASVNILNYSMLTDWSNSYRTQSVEIARQWVHVLVMQNRKAFSQLSMMPDNNHICLTFSCHNGSAVKMYVKKYLTNSLV